MPSNESTVQFVPASETNAYPYVDVTSLTFGVEIECHLPTDAVINNNIMVGGYHSDNGQVPDSVFPAFNGKRWKATSDGSIMCRSGRTPIEFVSPVLKGVAGLQNLMQVVRRIKELGGKVNASCGLHIHVGCDTSDLAAVQRITHLVAGFEKGVYASTGTKSREQGRFCKPIKNAYAGMRFTSHSAMIASAGAVRDRYHGLNLTNVINNGGRLKTVEFRYFAGTLNTIKIASHVQMVLGMVQVALGMPRPARWNGQAAGENYGANLGEGGRELNRLFTRLGWNTTRFYGRAGLLQGDGIPSLGLCMKVLRDMANKYDGLVPVTDNVTAEDAADETTPIDRV